MHEDNQTGPVIIPQEPIVDWQEPVCVPDRSNDGSGTIIASEHKIIGGEIPPFNPNESMVVIASWPKGHANIKLMTWLFSSGYLPRNMFHHSWQDILCAYNRAVKNIVLPSDYQWITFCDNDLAAGPATTPFLHVVGADIVGCQYPVGSDASWGEPTRIHTGLFRCHRKVLEAMQPPWFMHTYSEDGCQQVKCCCENFREKAIALGFTVKRAGWANHKVSAGDLI